MKAVYTFADLQSWETVTADEKLPLRLAVLGDPIAHSASPPMHNAALSACGLEMAYCRLHIHPEELAAALHLLPSKGFVGVNCTIPHKGGALAIVDEADTHARLAGSVNTIRIGKDGLLEGFSTDGLGLERAVSEQLGVELSTMRVLVLGAGGGAGQAVSMHCANADVRHLTLINRTVEKLHPLQEAIAEIYPREQISVAAWNDAALAKALDQSDLVVNCSSLGMKPEDPSPIPASLIAPRHLLFDTIYTADHTPLMRAAESAGARSANGLTMLLYQGEVAFEIWFQRPAPLDVMREALFAQARGK
ncbi:MAG: shikimate dehydrogenase [Chthoniobacter sp.]|uniref:shikimate dehydrogenase n=1 Tax=Chthoniobacter sp. TaxID=2510640 RepID=UPI0032ADCDA6